VIQSILYRPVLGGGNLDHCRIGRRRRVRPPTAPAAIAVSAPSTVPLSALTASSATTTSTSASASSRWHFGAAPGLFDGWRRRHFGLWCLLFRARQDLGGPARTSRLGRRLETGHGRFRFLFFFDVFHGL
jgi:hypothetical protein